MIANPAPAAGSPCEYRTLRPGRERSQRMNRRTHRKHNLLPVAFRSETVIRATAIRRQGLTIAVLARHIGWYFAAPVSPQSSNLRVGPQLPLQIVTAGPEDDASGAAGLELDETFAQLLASACEGHLFGGGHVDERVMAVRDVEVMTAVNGEMTDIFVCT